MLGKALQAVEVVTFDYPCEFKLFLFRKDFTSLISVYQFLIY